MSKDLLVLRAVLTPVPIYIRLTSVGLQPESWLDFAIDYPLDGLE
jgi:hypothetical protein